jgi:5-methylcytosine-specific restriction endonuclease McrA
MFQPPSRIQGKRYVTRWATWRKTLKAFVDWSNADDQTQEPNEPEPDTNSLQELSVRPNRTEVDCREVRPGLRFKVFMRDRFRCVACGRSPATHLNIELHADHVLAVANGGKTTLENLQSLCQDCNLGKGRTVVA